MSYWLGCADTMKLSTELFFCVLILFTYIMNHYEFDLFKATLNWNVLLLVVLRPRSHTLSLSLSSTPSHSHCVFHVPRTNTIHFQFGVFFWTPLVMLLPSKATNLPRSSGILCWSLPCNEWQNFFVLLQSSFSDKLNIENDGSPVTSLTIFRNFGKQFRSLSPSSDEYVSSNIKPLHLRKLENNSKNWTQWSIVCESSLIRVYLGWLGSLYTSNWKYWLFTRKQRRFL